MEGSLRGHDVKWLALCRPGECAFADRARSQGRATGKRKERAAVSIYDTAEGARLRLNEQRVGHWNRWGPYLAERAWGTVREDYSADGCAWEYFPHDHARSRVYRWNEDGLGGICDRRQYLCFAPALWNGRDPILKERMFGLTNSQGNHGEDVKEYYYYLDNTPSHSYMRFLYKYPQAAYPYERLIRENAARSRLEPEYELLDTGVFDESRYFDVEIEYAKLAAEDIFIRIGVANRGPEPAAVTVLPTLWFRNTWSWGRDDRRPTLGLGASNIILAEHWELGRYALYCDEPDEIVFTENETNSARLFGWPSRTPYVKDAFHAYVVDGRLAAVDPPPAPCETRRRTRPGSVRRRRRRLRTTQSRGGRILCAVHPGDAVGRGEASRPSGFRRAAVVEAILPLRGGGLAGGRPRATVAAGGTQKRAQPRVATRLLQGRHRDARHLGISLVRGVGSGVPLQDAGPYRSAICKGPNHPDVSGVVLERGRPSAGLRVGVRRRQSARPRRRGAPCLPQGS